MQYLKVYQNVNNSFNLNYKPSFYDMLFTSYTVVANSAIYNLCDVKKTLFWIRQCLQPGIFSEGIFMLLTCQKLFLFEKLEATKNIEKLNLLTKN